ncbi:MAG: recombinase family protein [Solirubrobacteraceae bacterium]
MSEPHERAPTAILFLPTGVSTGQQNLALQLDALTSAGCRRIFRDVGSGSLKQRPQPDECLSFLQPGDTLVVWCLDRLGRGLKHLIEVVEQLQAREIGFKSLTGSQKMTMPAIANALGVSVATLYRGHKYVSVFAD